MLAGQRSHTIGPLTMDRAAMERFAAFSGDRSPLHMDPGFGTRSQFADNVVHGVLPLMYLPLLVQDALYSTSWRITRINAQFLKPLFPGEQVHLACVLEGTEDAPDLEYRVLRAGTEHVVTRGRIALQRSVTAPLVTGAATGLFAEAPILSSFTLEELNKGLAVAAEVQFGPGQRQALATLIGQPAIDGTLAAQMACVALLSTTVGMLLPGRTALFQDFSATFDRPVPSGPATLALRTEVATVSASTRSFTQQVELTSSDGVHMKARLTAGVTRPDHIPPSMDDLRNNALSTGLQDKVVLITGAARGIGATTAKLFALHGARVVVNYRQADADAMAVVNEINASGGRAMAVRGDVSDAAAVKDLMSTISKAWGPVDVLVNGAAAGFHGQAFQETTWDHVQRDIDVIVKGAFLCAQAVLPGMIERGGGRIINLGTVATEVPPKEHVKYVVAKSALTGLTRSLAVELAQYNILVNQVTPSMVETDLTKGTGPVALGQLRAASPLKRLATTTEVAQAIVFLASAQAGYTTGQQVRVTGGMPPFA
jgi:3-oxoacyl-[acyl-carrier protein] reductase